MRHAHTVRVMMTGQHTSLRIGGPNFAQEYDEVCPKAKAGSRSAICSTHVSSQHIMYCFVSIVEDTIAP